MQTSASTLKFLTGSTLYIAQNPDNNRIFATCLLLTNQTVIFTALLLLTDNKMTICSIYRTAVQIQHRYHQAAIVAQLCTAI